MSSPDIQIEVFGKTDVGLIREHNEDNLLVADLGGSLKEAATDAPAKLALGEHGALFLVCDGMGGAAAGEVASQMAVDAIFDVMAGGESQPARDTFARLLRRAVETANERIFQQSRDNQSERGMGTTCTAAALIDDTLVIAQIGDSRCYVMRNRILGQVTKDQSLAWQLIEAGALTHEDAKAFEHANIILQALGVQDHVEVVLSQVPLRRGDVVLLCSDGLHGPVGDDEIRDILVAAPDLKQAGESLLQRALERDGPDNVTVVLARLEGSGLSAPLVDERTGFVGYDPGPDPLSDEAMDSGRSGRPTTATMENRTIENRAWATAAATATTPTTQPNRLDAAPVASATKKKAATPARGSAVPDLPQRRFDWRQGVLMEGPRSLAIVFLVGLLAVAAGGIVALKCDRAPPTQEVSR
jgi:serine/threonine protein phosphatase PrpC